MYSFPCWKRRRWWKSQPPLVHTWSPFPRGPRRGRRWQSQPSFSPHIKGAVVAISAAPLSCICIWKGAAVAISAAPLSRTSIYKRGRWWQSQPPPWAGPMYLKGGGCGNLSRPFGSRIVSDRLWRYSALVRLSRFHAHSHPTQRY